MIDVNVATVLANLDWLQHHRDMKLDYAAGVVYGSDGEPEYMLEDLATAGLTPATAPEVIEGYDVAKRALAESACYRSPLGIMVHGPGCPHTP